MRAWTMKGTYHIPYHPMSASTGSKALVQNISAISLDRSLSETARLITQIVIRGKMIHRARYIRDTSASYANQGVVSTMASS